MNTVGIQPKTFGEQNLVAHKLVRRKCVKTFGMIRLVEAHLQIYRLVVQRHVWISVSGQFGDANFALPEIGVHAVDCFYLLFIFVFQHDFHFVEIRIVERPQMLFVDFYFKAIRSVFEICQRRHNGKTWFLGF